MACCKTSYAPRNRFLRNAQAESCAVRLERKTDIENLF
jgi:hypothetical protein